MKCASSKEISPPFCAYTCSCVCRKREGGVGGISSQRRDIRAFLHGSDVCAVLRRGRLVILLIDISKIAMIMFSQPNVAYVLDRRLLVSLSQIGFVQACNVDALERFFPLILAQRLSSFTLWLCPGLSNIVSQDQCGGVRPKRH